MEQEQLADILACLDQKKWIVNFYEDCYAVFVLHHWLMKRGGTAPVRSIKASPMAKLLNKPILKQLTAKAQDISTDMLEQIWSTQCEPLVITLGKWGQGRNGYGLSDQTSRPGTNLVLQVNLSNQWNRSLQRALSMDANECFDCGHPINSERACTLGWVRLDLDFTTNEVLIEEVQSDFVRWIKTLHEHAQQAWNEQDAQFRYRGRLFNAASVRDGLQGFNSMVFAQWQEALLWTALWFCKKELGMDNIFYHTYETGAMLKSIGFRKPPKSLYSSLPKKFCFELTETIPRFLASDRRAKRRLKAHKEVAFYKWVA